MAIMSTGRAEKALLRSLRLMRQIQYDICVVFFFLVLFLHWASAGPNIKLLFRQMAFETPKSKPDNHYCHKRHGRVREAAQCIKVLVARPRDL